MVLEVVTIRKWKRPAGSGSWRGYALGQDRYGSWVFTPRHSTYTGVRPDGRKETYEVSADPHHVGRHSVVLLPPGHWYVARWVFGSGHLIDVGIATPPMRFGDTWVYDDLELALHLERDGTLGVDGEDEFDIACGRRRIGPVARRSALHEVRSLRRQLTAESAVLVHEGVARLARGRALGLPPL